MATVVNATSWSRNKGDTSSITIPSATAGNTLVFVCAGGAIASATGFTKRTTYGGGTQDVSISDKVAAGGETSVAISETGSGENVAGIIYELHGSLTFTSASNNGTGTTIQTSNDFQLAPASVTVPANSLLVAVWSVGTSVAFSQANQWRQMGPLGKLWGNAGQQPGTNFQFIWASGLADITAGAQYPQQLSAGNYEATSVYLAGGTGYVAQAVYTDNSGVATNPAPANNIVAENSLPGAHYANWYLGTSGTDSTIAGYTDLPSYPAGATVNFKVDSSSNPFRVEIYREGWYGWELFGARHVLGNQAGYITGTVTAQPAPTVDSTLGSTSCGWTTNATWAIPSNAVPGVYTAVFRRTDLTTHAASCYFVVRGNTSGSAVVVTPSPTWQAYNCWGATTDNGTSLGAGTWTGRSLYQIGTDGASSNFGHRSYAVSYDRPYATQSMRDQTFHNDVEHGWIVFAEAQGYNLGYCDEIDLDTGNASLTSASLVVMLGHHEYISTAMYNAYQAAITSGVNVFVQSSNTALWRARFAAGDTSRRTMICYKDSGTRDVSAGWSGTGYDPVSPTGTWRDPNPTNGVTNPDRRRENALTGQLFTWSGPITIPAVIDFAHKGSPIWRNSANVQALTSGGTFSTVANSVGQEVDCADGSAGQPSNLVALFAQSLNSASGSNAAGTVYTSNVTNTIGWTLYRAASGALVFNTGSWRGFWDITRWRASAFPNSGSVGLDLQNALNAILYDLGMRPQTVQALQPGQDSTLSNPAAGAPGGGRNGVAVAYGLTVSAPTVGFFALINP